MKLWCRSSIPPSVDEDGGSRPEGVTGTLSPQLLLKSNSGSCVTACFLMNTDVHAV